MSGPSNPKKSGEKSASASANASNPTLGSASLSFASSAVTPLAMANLNPDSGELANERLIQEIGSQGNGSQDLNPSKEEESEEEESVLGDNEAFRGIFEREQLEWLNDFGLTQEQLRKIEGDPDLHIDCANKLISVAVQNGERYQELQRLKAAYQAGEAGHKAHVTILSELLQTEIGWTAERVSAEVAKKAALLRQFKELHEQTAAAMQSPAATTASVAAGASASATVNVTTNRTIRITEISTETVRKLIDYLRQCVADGIPDNRTGTMSTEAQAQLYRALISRSGGRVKETTSSSEIMRWPANVLADVLDVSFPRAGIDRSNDWIHAFNKLFVELDVRVESSYRSYLNAISTSELSAVNQTTAVTEVIKTLIDNLTKVPSGAKGKVTNCNKAIQLMLRDAVRQGKLKSLEQYAIRFEEYVQIGLHALERASVWENKPDQHAPSGEKYTSKRSFGEITKAPFVPAQRTCEGCGQKAPVNPNVGKNECRQCIGHPDRNTSGPWASSDSAKALADSGHRALHSSKRINGEPLTAAELQHIAEQKESKFPAKARFVPQQSSEGSSNKMRNLGQGRGGGGGGYGGRNSNNRGGGGYQGRGHGRGGGRGGRQGELNATTANNIIDMHRLVTCELTTNNVNSLSVQVLPDSGAFGANYVSRSVAQWIHGERCNICVLAPEIALSKAEINLGGTNSTCVTEGVVSCHFKFLNELNNSTETINCLEFKILDSDYDCIIDINTIRKYKLARKIPSFFENDQDEVANLSCASAPVPSCAAEASCSCAHPDLRSFGNICGSSEKGKDTLQPWYSDSLKVPLSEISALRLSVLRDKEELLGEVIADNDDIEWKDDPFDTGVPSTGDANNVLQKISVHGSPRLQDEIRNLCGEFKDIFSEHVSAEPAKVPPMEITVDEGKWFINKNRLPPRPQSEARQRAIQKQVELYKKLRVIEESNASAHSQVHLVPKPDPNEWRFCLDFVRLNEATVGLENWPIPNIPNMIQRIGAKKPKVFGVMDMTSGYHQAPLSPAARLLTAFICFVGLFHWLRVPMGLKNAAAYFQRVMATVVLSGIIYVLCELYIDDVFVFGRDDNEFISNLRQVFERMRKHNITLNPKKVCLGQDNIEFVGHVINADGITFSGEKRDKVLNFPLPTKSKQLMGFIGLVNYFRDHVPDMTGKLKALRALTRDKNKPIQWTKETEKQFYYVRDEVAKCPTLFFLDPNAAIYVLTDASDYGYGAYIFQIGPDGKERPVIFLSKAFTGAQLNWSTIEKEAYAIFFTLKTYEYLLKDVKFTLRTDHKNLTYLTLEGSQKVRRWRLFIQEFNFVVEHIAGEDNIVADAFSRLCAIDATDRKEFVLCAREEENVRIPEENYRQIQSVHNATLGHFGVEETLSKLQEKGLSWKYMRGHVRQFIRKCGFCQANSDRKIVTKVVPFTRAAYHPMEVLNIDTIGPLPKDDAGNEYILVIIDCFSRWIELYATPDTSAESAAQPLLQHCGRFGIPSKIRSDRGSQFVNKLIGHLSGLFLTEQDLTTAYSKEENAIVERANKEVLRHLKAVIFDERIYRKWSTNQLPLIQRILNSEEKKRTGVSPAEILFGNAINLSRHLLFQPVLTETEVDLPDYLQHMLERQSAIIKVAQETQREFDSHHMSRNDPDLSDFPVNSYVLFENPAGGRNKLQTKLQGPYQVVARRDNEIIIKDLLSHKEVRTHISNIRDFNFDAERTDPVEIAMHSQQEFVIDSILEHTGDRYRRTSLNFKVRWQGFGPEHDSWEPYQYLRDTEQLHTYLRANRMTSLIPAKFK